MSTIKGVVGLVLLHAVAFAQQPVVLDRQEVVTGDHSITYERIVPPILKPQPPQIKAPLSASSAPAPEKATGPEPVQLTLVSQQTDAGWSEVQFQHGDQFFSFRTTLPMRHLNMVVDLVQKDRASSFFQINLDPSLDEETLARQRRQPLTPLPTRYVWMGKAVVPSEIKQAIEDLHRHYQAHQASITQAYFEQQAAGIAEEKARAANPPKKKEEILRYFPIRSTFR